MAIRRLGELNSASAAILLRLDLTRETSSEAIMRLRLRRRQQVNLLCILSDARYTFCDGGVLPPTWCPETIAEKNAVARTPLNACYCAVAPGGI